MVERFSFRLTLGVTLAAAIGFGAGLPLPFVPPLLALVLLAPATPPPGPRQILLLFLILAIACLSGLLVGEILQMSRPAGLLLMLSAVAIAAGLAQKPQAQAAAAILILGTCLIGTVATVSSAAGRTVAGLVALSVAIGLGVVHLVHALLPGASPASPPPPASSPPAHLGARAALVMAPPLLLALANPSAFILLVMKGATLAQQPHAESTRALAIATIVSTAAGGAAALLLWFVLRLWPSLPLLLLLIAAAALFTARGLYGLRPSPFGPDHWMNFLITLLVLLGSAVADSRASDDIEVEILTRTVFFLALSLYAAAAVRLLDRLLATPTPGDAGMHHLPMKSPR
jgi:hypothetical protein